MMKIVKVCSALAAAAAMSALADTVSVPAGTTVALDASTDYSATTFSMAGGTLDLNGRTATAGGVTLASGTNTFANTGASATLTAASNIDCSNKRGAKFTGGSWVFNNISIGEKSGDGYFEVSGAETSVRFNRTGGYYLGGDYSAYVRINGGTTRFANGFGMWTATALGSVCDIEVNDGTFIAEDVIKTLAGKVDIRVNGGTFKPYYLRFGDRTNYSGTQPHILTVNGGLVDVQNEFTLGWLNTSTSPFFLKLYGGVLQMPKISRKNVTGATTFLADGGTVRPRSAQTSFISGFDTAVLGETGLTVDATYAITIPQDITGLADGAAYGTLVKTGSAALTLSGALCDGVRFENRAGATTLSGASGAVRVTATEGTVTLAAAGSLGAGSEIIVNGGTVTLNGTVDPTVSATVTTGTLEVNADTTLASLTVGGATTKGNLVIAAGKTLTVTGSVSGSLFYSDYDLTVTKDASGTHIVRATSTDSATVPIRLEETGATSNATEDVVLKMNDLLDVYVAQGSTLALAGLYGRGALRKDGPGAAVLSNAGNWFLGGVTQLVGRLVASSPQALGIGASDLTQKGGTVDITGGTALTSSGSYRIDAESATAAVVFKNEADVTFANVGHVQGAIIKRGAGTLTIDPRSRATKVALSRSVGVGSQSCTPMTFDDTDGVPPTTGYGGFNIAEGKVVLKNGMFNFLGNTAMIGMPMTSELKTPVALVVSNADVTVAGNGNDMFYVGSGLTTNDYGQTVSVTLLDSTWWGQAPFCIGGYEKWQSTSTKSKVYLAVTNSTIGSAQWQLVLNENRSGGTTYLWAKNSNFYLNSGFRLNGYCENILDGCVYGRKNSDKETLQGTIAPQPVNWSPNTGFTRFTGGSHAYFTSFGGDGGCFRHTVIFDNATLHMTEVMKMRWANGNYPINYYFKTEGEGVTLPVASGTLRNTVRLEGTGPLVKTGTGELFFDTRAKWNTAGTVETKCADDDCSDKESDTWSFTGAADVREGTLSVTNGALASAVKPVVKVASGATWKLLGDMTVTGATVSGAGTVTGGTLAGLTISGVLTEEGAAGEVPTIASALSGRTCVDFGKACAACATLPKNVLVAKVSAANVSTWRATNIGCSGVHATFRAADGEVRCDFARGFVLTIR